MARLRLPVSREADTKRPFGRMRPSLDPRGGLAGPFFPGEPGARFPIGKHLLPCGKHLFDERFGHRLVGRHGGKAHQGHIPAFGIIRFPLHFFCFGYLTRNIVAHLVYPLSRALFAIRHERYSNSSFD